MRRVIGVVLVVALVVAPFTVGLLSGPAAGQSVGITNDVESFERLPNGDLLVLERFGSSLRDEGDLAYIHRYSDGPKPENTVGVTAETIPANASTDLVDFFRAREGGWWLVAGNGTLYHFTDGWQYSGRSKRLPGIETRPHYKELDAATRGPDGFVWVSTYGDLWVYDPELTGLEATYDTLIETDREHSHAIYDEIEFTDGGVFVLSGTTGHWFDREPDGPLLADTTADRTRRFRDPMGWRTALEPVSDGDWLLINEGGRLHRVTGSLVYTGIGRTLETELAEAGVPDDVFGLGDLLPFGAAVRGLVLLAPLWWLPWAVRRGLVKPTSEFLLAASAGGVVLYSVYLWPAILRPEALTIPLPDVTVPLLTLAGVGTHLGVTAARGGTRTALRTLGVAYAPLVIAAVDLMALLTVGVGVPLLF